MPASYRKIDYSLRPAKHTERKMLIEIFRRLAAFEALESYAYSGMGSVWFSDFVLVHRVLGIRSMTSMEWQKGPIERIASNVPLGAIRLIHKDTSQAIPMLDWDRRQIVWLDYDGLVSPSVLLDVDAVVGRVRSGSVLAISVQCNQADEIDAAASGQGADALTLFKDKFGSSAVGEIDEDDLRGWGFGSTSRRLITQRLEARIAEINLSKSGAEKLKYTTICHIEYADDARMTTLVVLFYTESETEAFERCNFSVLDFLAAGPVIRIEMPNLTLLEMRHLQSQLPMADIQMIDYKHMPRQDALKYAKLYRYLPNFSVLEI